MRLWSLNPCYLDQKGLCGVWVESLLAQKALQCNTKGYKNHPQLIRFKNCKYPLRAIGDYLTVIWFESRKREYNFDCNKIECFSCFRIEKIDVTHGQLEYEFEHLQKKLKDRDNLKFRENNKRLRFNTLEPHPLFRVIKGDVEPWEKI